MVSKSAGSSSGIFVGATPQNNDDELYDDADVSEDDFAEFDMDEDEEQVTQKVKSATKFSINSYHRLFSP